MKFSQKPAANAVRLMLPCLISLVLILSGCQSKTEQTFLTSNDGRTNSGVSLTSDDLNRAANNEDTAASTAECCCATESSPDSSVSKTDSCEYIVPAVSLVDQDGTVIESPALFAHEGPIVVQFFFTSCATLCPVLTSSLSAMQDEIGDEHLNRTLLVSISIDPNHDSPDRLREFASQFDTRTNWRFVTGAADDIRQLQTAFDAYQQNKMQHLPLTFIRSSPESKWTRLNGLISGNELAREFLASVRRSEQANEE